MKRITIINIILAATLTLYLGTTVAQQEEEVTVIAPFDPSIKETPKLNPSPQQPQMNKEPGDYNFSILDKRFDPELELAIIQPRQTSKDPVPDYTRNYIRAGIGSNLTPYLEVVASMEKKKGFQPGLRFNHLSTWSNIKEYAPSSSSYSDLTLFGKWSNKKHSLGADIDYNRWMVHNYGFKPDSFPEFSIDKESIRQRYQTLGASFSMERNYSSSDLYKYNLTAGFYHLDNITETRENSLYFKSSWARMIEIDALEGKSQIAVEIDLDHFNYADSLQSLKRNYFRVMPYFQLEGESFRLLAGANLYFSNDSADHFNLYPVIRGEYVILEKKLRAYAGVRGREEIRGYRSLVLENPHLISTPELRNTKESFEVYAGITGSASSLDYFLEISGAWGKDYRFMVLDTSLLLQNEFTLVYDDAQVLKISGGISYQKIKQLELSLKAVYRDITPKNEIEPWSERNAEIRLGAKYYHKQNLQFGATLAYLGPFYYRSFAGNEIIPRKVDGGLDLNLYSEYKITDQITVFLNLYNILNNNYLQWYDYPVQGFQAMAGGSFSF